MQDQRKQIQEFLSTNVNNFVQPMVYDMVKKRPKNPAAFALKWIKEYIGKKQQEQNSGSDCSDEVEMDEATLHRARDKARKRSRQGISQEVFGNYHKEGQIECKNIPKSEEARLLILGLLRSSILFSNISSNDEQTVINAMAEKMVQEGERLIEEGDKGDSLFIVAEGEFDCFKIINGEQKHLKTYRSGEAFGELALMYNAPRAASIAAKTSGKVFQLDRMTFNHIVKKATVRKRELYNKVISSVDIFGELSTYEKQKFQDALKEVEYQGGDYVIKQGDEGKEFYIVIEGRLVAEKQEQSGELPRIVYQYKEGDYFGELSLVHDITRQASVKALTNVRLASIERGSFKRLLGNLQEILKRNEERYSSLQERIAA